MLRSHARFGWLLALSTLAIALAASACGGPDYPLCENDENCQSHGEFCVNGHCQQCRNDTDCREGQSCNSGRCEAIEGRCGSDGDCPSGQRCRGNRCVGGAAPPPPPDPPPPAAECQLEPVYFAFDSSELTPAARDIIARNGDCGRQRGITGVTLTGYCDPRGTEQYNLALGERRAQAVRRYLVSLGAPESALSTHSVGSEFAQGADEDGWSRDRRVEFNAR